MSLVLETLVKLWADVSTLMRHTWFHDHVMGSDEPTRLHELKLGFVFMLAFGIIREYIFGKLMVERMGEYLGVMVDTIALKLINQWISLGMHVFITLWAVVYLPSEEWSIQVLHGNGDPLYVGVVSGEVTMSIPFKVFYMIHLGYQLHALQFTVQEGTSFTADRRADYRQMVLHHVIAVTLIVLSYIMGYARIGALVMVSHNMSDITVCLTKSAKLLGWKRACLFLLPLMIVTWAVTRLIFFPFYVLWHVFRIPVVDMHFYRAVPLVLCIMGLVVLLLLNIFWFIKFLQMATNLIFRGNSMDVTESRATNDMADKYGVWNRQRWWEVGVPMNQAS
eukprot:TRINITY_DN4488_c0_g1_i1.p1 TRINITY_DN4488_c0_g1~~TRINITY_DN4488_c0_g1_i1.p1  ORF type:complete len:335 (+),score=63.10 TRINITY_DN4488_c0_g1_i1:50-1054(+)